MTTEQARAILKEELELMDIYLSDAELKDFWFDGSETEIDIHYMANDYRHDLATSKAIDKQFIKELDIW